MTGPELSALLDRVQALEQSVEDLMTGGVPGATTITTTETAPEIRTRVLHKRTEKRGWELSEITTECTTIGVPDWDAIRAEMRRAFAEGTVQAVEFNQYGKPEEAAS